MSRSGKNKQEARGEGLVVGLGRSFDRPLGGGRVLGWRETRGVGSDMI